MNEAMRKAIHQAVNEATRRATRRATQAPALADRRALRYFSAMRWGVDMAPRVGHPLPRTLSRRGQGRTRVGEPRVRLVARLAEREFCLDWLMVALGQAIDE